MLSVLFEDNHLVIINKNSSDIVQGDKTGDEPLSEKVKTYLKNKYQKPGNVFLGVPHRLDRPVSGIVIFARTSKALSRMAEMFKEKEIKKTYWAIVEKAPNNAQDKLVHYLRKDEAKNKSFASSTEKEGYKKSILSYSMLSSSENYHLLEVELETGRHHQIRVQLSTIGCPIKGDVKYGARRANKDASIHLHSRKVEFIHPVTKERIQLTAAVPDEDNLWKFFEDSVRA